jgi:hypothetical protein
MLEYSLHENRLTERTDDFAAQTHVKASYNKEELVELMLQRGTLMTKTDAIAVLNNLEETIAYIIRSGGMVHLPLFHTGFSITGVFDDATDSFDPHRHQLHVNINKGTQLRALEGEVKLTKINAAAPQPQIIEVKDCETGKVDDVLTVGGAVEINGVHIKISGDKPACGLYFIDESGTETKSTTLIQNKPAAVFAMVPPLSAGNYHIKIVTQHTGGKDLKDPKATIYGKTLRVL